jgi:hypothetical protein
MFMFRQKKWQIYFGPRAVERKRALRVFEQMDKPFYQD